MITSVTVAFQQRNQRPEIASITIQAPGVVFQKPFSTGEAEIAGYDGPPLTQRPGPSANAGARPSRLPERSADVPLEGHGSERRRPQLRRALSPRRRDDMEGTEAQPSDALLVWDTTSVPNGTYVIKVIASDASANSPGSALVAERESDTFDIDNSPPTISIASVANVGGKTAVRFTVKDADSPVAARGVLARRRALASDLSRWTGSPIHAPRSTSWCSIRS